MDEQQFRELVTRVSLGLVTPTIFELNRLRTPGEMKERPRVTPADVVASLIHHMPTDLRRAVVPFLFIGVDADEKERDPRAGVWADALHLLFRKQCTAGDKPDPGLAKWIEGRTLTVVRHGDRPKKPKIGDTASFQRRMLASIACVLVRERGLKPTRSRESRRYPKRSGDPGIAEGGSACDVAAVAVGDSFAVAARAWGDAVRKGWLVRDRDDQPNLPNCDGATFPQLRILLPVDYGDPRKWCVSRAVLAPFLGDPRLTDLPAILTVHAWEAYMPEGLVNWLVQQTHLGYGQRQAKAILKRIARRHRDTLRESRRVR